MQSPDARHRKVAAGLVTTSRLTSMASSIQSSAGLGNPQQMRKPTRGRGRGRPTTTGRMRPRKPADTGAGGEVENISRTFVPRQGGIAPVHRPPTDKWA